MKKSELKGFINKYSMPKSKEPLEKVKWVFGDDGIVVDCMDRAGEILGQVKFKDNHSIYDGDVGIMKTKQLARIVDAMDDEFDFNVDHSSFNMKDGKSKSQFITANPNLIAIVPTDKIETLPEFEIEFDVDSEFIRKFEKSIGAFDGVEMVAFVREDGKDNLIINYDSEIDVSNIRLELNTTKTVDTEYKLIFSADWFKNMLSEHKDCDVTVGINTRGLLKFSAHNDIYETRLFIQSRG